MIRLKKISDSPTNVSSTDTVNRQDFKKIIDNKFDQYYGNDDNIHNLQKKIHKALTVDYKDITPHVNGYYYIHMVHGTWKNDIIKQTFNGSFIKNNEFSTFTKEHFANIDSSFGQFATDIDVPQINIDYESISGKNRNLNYASKLNYNGDFSINFLENNNNMIFRYHEAWYKYIDAYKKGFVKKNVAPYKDDAYFVDVSYYNAVWVAVFAPFTTNIRLLIKIMGAAPVNLPFKQIIGDRTKSSLSTINQTYKSNDMIYKFYEDEKEYAASPFFQEFLHDMGE